MYSMPLIKTYQYTISTYPVLFCETSNIGDEGSNEENISRHHVSLFLQLFNGIAPAHLQIWEIRERRSCGTFSLASPPTNLLARLIVAPVASASC